MSESGLEKMERYSWIFGIAAIMLILFSETIVEFIAG